MAEAGSGTAVIDPKSPSAWSLIPAVKKRLLLERKPDRSEKPGPYTTILLRAGQLDDSRIGAVGLSLGERLEALLSQAALIQ
jgi:hypothetical protein